MVPSKQSCHPEFISLVIGRRQVTADFTGGHTSDAGLALVAQLDRHYRITKRFAKCFEDHRDPKRVQHSLEDLIAQRVYGLQGYEDVNDHDCSLTDVWHCRR